MKEAIGEKIDWFHVVLLDTLLLVSPGQILSKNETRESFSKRTLVLVLVHRNQCKVKLLVEPWSSFQYFACLCQHRILLKVIPRHSSTHRRQHLYEYNLNKSHRTKDTSLHFSIALSTLGRDIRLRSIRHWWKYLSFFVRYCSFYAMKLDESVRGANGPNVRTFPL